MNADNKTHSTPPVKQGEAEAEVSVLDGRELYNS